MFEDDYPSDEEDDVFLEKEKTEFVGYTSSTTYGDRVLKFLFRPIPYLMFFSIILLTLVVVLPTGVITIYKVFVPEPYPYEVELHFKANIPYGVEDMEVDAEDDLGVKDIEDIIETIPAIYMETINNKYQEGEIDIQIAYHSVIEMTEILNADRQFSMYFYILRPEHTEWEIGILTCTIKYLTFDCHHLRDHYR